MSICESCIRNKDCKWNKGNPRHCTLYTDKEETNFESITASPEALAEFIVKLVDDCTIRHECGICHSWCDEKVVTKWLKQESDAK